MTKWREPLTLWQTSRHENGQMQQGTIKNILCGDFDAYDTVVLELRRTLLGYAPLRLADVDAASDFVQLTFIRAYERNQPCQSIAESLDRTVTWVTTALIGARKAHGSYIERRLAEETAG